MALFCVHWRRTRASALIVQIHSARRILYKLLENWVLNYFGYPCRQQRFFLVRGTNFCRTNGRYFYILYIKMTLIQWSVVGISRRNVGHYYAASLEGSVVTAGCYSMPHSVFVSWRCRTIVLTSMLLPLTPKCSTSGGITWLLTVADRENSTGSSAVVAHSLILYFNV